MFNNKQSRYSKIPRSLLMLLLLILIFTTILANGVSAASIGAPYNNPLSLAVLFIGTVSSLLLAFYLHHLINAQHKAEDTAHEKSNQFIVLQKAIEDSGSHVIITDTEGKITYANPAAQKITGFSLAEMLGQTPRLWKSNEMPEEMYKDFWKTIKVDKKVYKGEFVNKRKNGELYTVAVTVSPIIQDNELAGFIGTEVDISERVQWEKLLKQQKDQLIEAQKIGKIGDFNWNLRSNMITWSAEAFRIHGLMPTENFCPPPIDEYFNSIHPEDRDSARKSSTAATHCHEERTFIYRVIWPDSSVHWIRVISNVLFDSDDSPTIMKGTFQDISQEIEDKNRIEQENAKNEAILSSIADGLIMINQNGVIVLVNNASELIFGYKKDEMLGKKLIDIFPIKTKDGKNIENSDRPAIASLLSRNISTGVYQYVRKDKSTFQASITVAPVIQSNTVIGVIEVFRDVTREQNVDRMKTEFISLASHQLRTPLSAIKWFIELLQDDSSGALTQEQKEMITNIDLSNERMIALVNALLSVSRIESGRIIIDPRPTDMKKLVEEVITEIKPKLMSRNQKLILSIHKDLPIMNIDPDIIQQVYLNLLTNASKYTPENGEIMIIISENNDEIISQVSDNGYGIPFKDHARVFEKFYRGDNVVKRVTDGNGLGLYLVKAIVESSGGRIWFTSEENKGSSFMFSIPRSGSTAKQGEVRLNA